MYLSAAFEPMNFVNYLKYMGLGMLGIFIVIGIIMLLTVLLNAATKPKNNPDDKKR